MNKELFIDLLFGKAIETKELNPEELQKFNFKILNKYRDFVTTHDVKNAPLLSRIIYFFIKEDSKSMDDLATKIDPEKFNAILVDIVDNAKKITFSQMNVLYKHLTTNELKNKAFKNIIISEYEDIDKVNSTNFDIKYMTSMLEHVVKINEQNSKPRIDLLSYYFELYTNKEELIEKYSDDEKIKSEKILNYIADPKNKLFEKYVNEKKSDLFFQSVIIQNATTKDKLSNIINWNDFTKVNDVINSNQNLIKFAIELVKSGKVINDFFQIKNINFQQEYILQHAIDSESELVKGLALTPKVIASNIQLDFSANGIWKFEEKYFEKNSSKELLLKYLFEKNELNKNMKLTEEIILFLYESGYEEFYNSKQVDSNKHFEKIPVKKYIDKYYFVDSQKEFDILIKNLAEEKAWANKYNNKVEYVTFEELKNSNNNWKIKFEKLNKSRVNYDMSEIHHDCLNAQKSQKEIDEVISSLEAKISSLLISVNKYITEYTTLSGNKKELKVIENYKFNSLSEFTFVEKNLKDFKEQMINEFKNSQNELNRINSEIKNKSIVLAISHKNEDNIPMAKISLEKLTKKINSDILFINKWAPPYDSENHANLFVAASKAEHEHIQKTAKELFKSNTSKKSKASKKLNKNNDY